MPHILQNQCFISTETLQPARTPHLVRSAQHFVLSRTGRCTSAPCCHHTSSASTLSHPPPPPSPHTAAPHARSCSLLIFAGQRPMNKPGVQLLEKKVEGDTVFCFLLSQKLSLKGPQTALSQSFYQTSVFHSFQVLLNPQTLLLFHGYQLLLGLY